MNNRVKLIKVCCENGANNNKFYNMFDNGDGFFRVEYGRVGLGSAQVKTYPIRQWETKYNEKIRKGYKDTTHLFVETSSIKQFAKIGQKSIANIVERLQNYANHNQITFMF